MTLAVVRQISDTVSVRRDGRQADGGLVEMVFPHPESAHPSARLSG
jgi:peptide/nickel transport system ATP-binding protein